MHALRRRWLARLHARRSTCAHEAAASGEALTPCKRARTARTLADASNLTRANLLSRACNCSGSRAAERAGECGLPRLRVGVGVVPGPLRSAGTENDTFLGISVSDNVRVLYLNESYELFKYAIHVQVLCDRAPLDPTENLLMYHLLFQ